MFCSCRCFSFRRTQTKLKLYGDKATSNRSSTVAEIRAPLTTDTMSTFSGVKYACARALFDRIISTIGQCQLPPIESPARMYYIHVVLNNTFYHILLHNIHFDYKNEHVVPFPILLSLPTYDKIGQVEQECL